MRAVTCSDAHADHVTYGVRRHADVRRALMTAVANACGRANVAKADAFFYLGDLSDPEDGPAALAATELLMGAALELESESVPTVIIAGNHDVIDDGSGRTTLSPLRALQGRLITVNEQPGCTAYVDDMGATFLVASLPFTSPSHPYDPGDFLLGLTVERLLKDWPLAPLFILSHLAVPGVQPGEETKEIPRGREVLYPFAAVADLMRRHKGPVVCLQGHYHRRQTFRAPQGYDIHIPGSMARLTLTEERNDPGFLSVEV